MALPFRLAMGWSAPRQPVLGAEGAGEVVGLGAGASRFALGQEVIVFPGMKMGCHAELLTIKETGRIIAKPARLSVAEAGCMMFGGMTALDYLRRKAGLAKGERLLVNGASGTVGSAAVQVGHLLGAEVTGVTSTGNLDMVRSLGADAVVDYTQGQIPIPAHGYDVILDCAGSLPYAKANALLAKGGRLVRVFSSLPEMILAPLTGRRDGHRIIAGVSAENRDDMLALAAWAEAGLYRPLIDSQMPFSEIAGAFDRVATGRKRGSVVVLLPPMA
jgi:NADPH:quinone reductase-like Zn-dependent oxidoreductase